MYNVSYAEIDCQMSGISFLWEATCTFAFIMQQQSHSFTLEDCSLRRVDVVARPNFFLEI